MPLTAYLTLNLLYLLLISETLDHMRLGKKGRGHAE